MAIDVTLSCGQTSLKDYLSTYDVRTEVKWGRTITTLGKKEYASGKTERLVVTFSFRPLSDAEASTLYNLLLNNSIATWTFTDPHNAYTSPATEPADKTDVMRLTSSLDSAFGIKSVNGKRYYKGGSIVLRQVQAA